MLKIITKVLMMVIPMISPEIKKEIVSFIYILEKKAKATPNPIDDVVVALMIAIIEED